MSDYQNNLYQCSKCDGLSEDVVDIHNGEHVCLDCLKQYVTCSRCNEYHPEKWIEKVGGEYVCESCFQDGDKIDE